MGQHVVKVQRRDLKKLVPGAKLARGLSITGSEAANAIPSLQRWLAANGVL